MWHVDVKSQDSSTTSMHRKHTSPPVTLSAYIDHHRKKWNNVDVVSLTEHVAALEARVDKLVHRWEIHDRRKAQRQLTTARVRLERILTGVHQLEFESLVNPYLATPTRSRMDECRFIEELDTVFEPREPQQLLVSGDECETCGVLLVVMASEAQLGCTRCGYTRTFLQTTSSNVPYGDEREFGNFSYKPKNHFQEWLNRLQVKEKCEVPMHVIEEVMGKLYGEGFRDPEQIEPQHIRRALSSLNKKKYKTYYDNVTQIFVRTTGKPPPRFTVFQEEQLNIMFNAVFILYRKHCPEDRKNFFSYPVLIHKLCQLCGYDFALKYLKLLKGGTKLLKQDITMQRIFHDLDWQFIPNTTNMLDWK